MDGFETIAVKGGAAAAGAAEAEEPPAPPPPFPSPPPHPGGAASPHAELRLLRFLDELRRQLLGTRDTQRALRLALRAAAGFFEAEAACIAGLTPGRDGAEVLLAHPKGSAWDAGLLADFALGSRPTALPGLLLARLKQRRRAWGTLALRVRAEGGGDWEADWGARNALTRVAAVVNECVQHTERERVLEVRARIDRKVMEQLRPQDLFYQVLHGLRSLTRYDHSAALLIGEEGVEELEIVAEQIAWRKGKSARVGRLVPVSEALRGAMPDGRAWGFTRAGERWEAWEPGAPAGLAELLDFDGADARDASADQSPARGGRGGGADSRREAEMLCAPLRTRAGALGLLKVSALHAGSLGAYEAELLGAFLPHASVALQNAQRTETLTAKMIEAERKHAIAELVRGVSHDVNNALGAMLPLVQQVRADLAAGRFDPDVAGVDLEHVERSVQVCRRIFGGMLGFARRSAKVAGRGEVCTAVADALAILEEGLRRRKVEVRVDVAPDLPAAPTGQSNLEQLFLNLIANARDATGAGGRIAISARCVDGALLLEVEDTGCGIPAEHLGLIQEPFFTTKDGGNGLGLTICRSIVWECGGRMEFDTEVGRGTRVTLTLPGAVAGAGTGAPEETP